MASLETSANERLALIEKTAMAAQERVERATNRLGSEREKLAQLARGREFEPFDRSLDVQVSRLRKMIEPDPAQPRFIQTVWGVGYVFVPDETA